MAEALGVTAQARFVDHAGLTFTEYGQLAGAQGLNVGESWAMTRLAAVLRSGRMRIVAEGGGRGGVAHGAALRANVAARLAE